MGTSAGPNLAGIGRGGDSKLVLEMDAHDAKSYPGEPTTNTIINGYFPGTDTTTVPTAWMTVGSTAIRAFRPAGEEFFYKGLGLTNPRVYQCKGGGWYSDASSGYIGVQMPNPTAGFARSTTTTISFWYRFTGENAAQLSNQYIWFDFDYGLPNLSSINYTVHNDTEWHLHSETVTSSASYDYYNLYIYARPYAQCPGGSYFEIGAIQIEQKGYPTPFVGDGQFARPASVDLMIHGNVGTGTTFEDSSPRKLALTNTNGVSHAGTSEFGGSALKFVRSSSQWIEVASSDAGNFGTGDWTIDYWFNMTSGQTDRMHSISMGTYASSNISLNFNDGNAFWLYWNGSGGNNIIWGSDGDYGDGAWHHMAVTRASGMIRVWVDGVWIRD